MSDVDERRRAAVNFLPRGRSRTSPAALTGCRPLTGAAAFFLLVAG